jgi:hypothetical protein
MTAHRPPRIGVCVIRLEQETTRLLCSLRMTEDVTRPSAERHLSFPSTDEAVKAVRDFVEHFAGGARPPAATGGSSARTARRGPARRSQPG